MDIVDLIEEIKKYPILYDPRIKSTPRKKLAIWEDIGERFGLTVTEVKSRWRSVKEKYIFLRKRADTYPGTEMAQQIEDYKYAEFLTFLDKTILAYANLPPPQKQKRTRYIPLSRSWDKSHTILLIKQLSMHPLLYDTTHPLYTHNFHRTVAYKKIANVLKRYKPEITPDMVSTKIRTVRTQYCKEKKYVESLSEKYGRPIEPKLWFYNKMSFLDNKYGSKNQTSSMVEIAPMFEQKFEHEDDDEEGEHLMEEEERYIGEQKDTTEEEVDDDLNNVDEWLSSSNDDSTKPFEEVEIQTKEHDYVEEEREENFEFSEIEEVFDHKESNSEKVQPNSKKNEIYAKCSELLDSLAKQLRPFEKDGKKTKKCDCENSAPSTVLGKMIETELSQVSEYIYVDAKWKIIRILEEAQRRHTAETIE